MSELRFAIAGAKCFVQTSGAPARIAGNYSEYPGFAGEPDLALHVEIDPAYPMGPAGDRYPAFDTEGTEDSLKVRRMDLEGRLELGEQVVGHFRAHPGEPALEAIVRLGLSLVFSRKNALILHSSAVECEGEVRVFSGHSGAGKSTISDLLGEHPNIRKVADDIVVVQKEGEHWWMCVAPFAAKTELPHGFRAPLGGIHLLEQAPTHKLERLDPKVAMARMIPNVVSYARSTKSTQEVLGLLAELIEDVPFYHLEFSKGPGIAEVLGITCDRGDPRVLSAGES